MPSFLALVNKSAPTEVFYLNVAGGPIERIVPVVALSGNAKFEVMTTSGNKYIVDNQNDYEQVQLLIQQNLLVLEKQNEEGDK